MCSVSLLFQPNEEKQRGRERGNHVDGKSEGVAYNTC
jgi:hypothetical protein